MESLHDDVLMLVLCWVPNPWGIQARAVCKRWRALLRSPAFAKLSASCRYPSSHAHDADDACAGAGDGCKPDVNMWLLLYTQNLSSPALRRRAQAHIVDPDCGDGREDALPDCAGESAAAAAAPKHSNHLLISNHVLPPPPEALPPPLISHDQQAHHGLDMLIYTEPALAVLKLGAFGYHPSSHLCMPVPLLSCDHRFYGSIDAGFSHRSDHHVHHIISDELLVSSHFGPLVCRRIISSSSTGDVEGMSGRQPVLDPSECPGTIKELYFEDDPLQLRRPSFGSGYNSTQYSGAGHGSRRTIPPPAGLAGITRAGVAPLLVNARKPARSHASNTTAAAFQILVMGGTVAATAHTEAEDHNIPLLYTSSNGGWWEALPPPPAPFSARQSQYPYSPRLSRSWQSTFVWWKESFCTLSGDAVYMFTPRTREWARVKLPPRPRIWDFRFLTIHALSGDRLIIEGNFQEQGDFVRRYPLRIGLLELLRVPPPPRVAAIGPAMANPATHDIPWSPANASMSTHSDAELGSRTTRSTHTWAHLGFMPDGLSRHLCAQQPGHPAHSFYTCYSHPRSPQLCFVSSSVPIDVGCGLCSRPARPQLVVFDIATESWNVNPLPPCSHNYVLSSPNFKGFTL